MIHHLLSHSDGEDWLKVNQFFMEQIAYLARKLDAINNILGSLDETEDYLQVRHFITSSDPNSSLDISNIQHDDGIDEDTWV